MLHWLESVNGLLEGVPVSCILRAMMHVTVSVQVNAITSIACQKDLLHVVDSQTGICITEKVSCQVEGLRDEYERFTIAIMLHQTIAKNIASAFGATPENPPKLRQRNSIAND